MTKKKSSTVPVTQHVKKTTISATPPDVGFRVFHVADSIDEHDYDSMLWAALQSQGDDKYLTMRVDKREVKLTDEKFTITKDDYGFIYYVGSAQPYDYVACMDTKISIPNAMFMLAEPTKAIILRHCAVSGEMLDALKFLHQGLLRDVKVHSYCPPQCSTCKVKS